MTTNDTQDPFRQPVVDAPDEVLAKRRPHAQRFALGMGALVAAAASALTATFFVATRSDDKAKSSGWATWQPTKSDQDGLDQIASHVMAQYKLDSGRRLLTIEAGLSDSFGAPLRPVVAFAKPGSKQGQTPGFRPLPDSTIFFRFCGTGDACRLAGKPSTNRMSLIRRQALELSLFSLRYNPDIDSVLVFLPPVVSQGVATGTAPPDLGILVRRADVAQALAAPLARTIESPAPRPGALTGPEVKRIDDLMRSKSFSVVQIQTQSGPAIVLDRLSG